MKRYLLAIAGIALFVPQVATAQPDYYGRRGAYDDRPYAPGYARDYRECQRDQGNRQATNAAIGAAAGGTAGALYGNARDQEQDRYYRGY